MLLERAAEFETSIARSLNDLEALTPEWNELWKRDSNATPFQPAAWLIPWAKHFTAAKLFCAVARAENQLVAFIPTFTWRNPETSARELLLLGTGISDYCDALCAPGQSRAINAAMKQLRSAVDWDSINFHDLRSTSPLLNDCFEEQSIAPVLELPGTVNELNHVIPKAQLQNLAYYRRRAEKLGNCRWQMADSHSLDEMMDELFALHSARWRDRSQRGAFDDENIRAFHREAARGLLNLGALRLFRLTIDEAIAAVLYGFTSHQRAYYYLSGFHPKFASASPGTLVIGEAIEQAVREGCTHFDFLRGAEKYKYLWGAKNTRTFKRVERRE